MQKPSEIIQAKINDFLKDLTPVEKASTSTEDLCAAAIQAIIDYLDEQAKINQTIHGLRT